MPDLFIPDTGNPDELSRYSRTGGTPMPTTPPPFPSLSQEINQPGQTPPLPEIVTNDNAPQEPNMPPFQVPTTTLSSDTEQEFPVLPNYNLVRESHTSGIPLFTSFWQNPTGVYFDTQGAHETILIFLRKHFITNVPWLLLTVTLVVLPFLLQYIVQYIHFNAFSLFLFSQVQLRIALTFYLILVFTYAFIKFLGWYYNISLITQERVLDIELDDLVTKTVSATKISLVQDVHYEQTGTLRSFLDYGDVLIQTAAAKDIFVVNSVPKPELVMKIVEDLIGKQSAVEA